jgi:hypothetical protein
MIFASHTFMGLTIGEWKDLTAAIASAATFVAIIVGGWWTWRRFRRTPESWSKVSLEVSPSWEIPQGGGSEYVRVLVTARNEGGWRQRLLVGDGAAEPSRVACWVLTTEAVSQGAGGAGYVDWTMAQAEAAPLLSQAVLLRPKDTWDETVLFPLPVNAEAARILVLLYVEAKRFDESTISTSSVITRPAKKE